MFKKFLCLSLVVLLLVGCNGSKTVKPILNNISFISKISYNDEIFVCETNIINDALNLKILKPTFIKGFSLSVDKNGANGEFKGIKSEFDNQSMPIGNVAAILYNIILDVSDKQAANADDNNCNIAGSVNDLKYSFTFAPSGLPIELSVKAIDLIIKFNNVTIIE